MDDEDMLCCRVYFSAFHIADHLLNGCPKYFHLLKGYKQIGQNVVLNMKEMRYIANKYGKTLSERRQ